MSVYNCKSSYNIYIYTYSTVKYIYILINFVLRDHGNENSKAVSQCRYKEIPYTSIFSRSLSRQTDAQLAVTFTREKTSMCVQWKREIIHVNASRRDEERERESVCVYRKRIFYIHFWIIERIKFRDRIQSALTSRALLPCYTLDCRKYLIIISIECVLQRQRLRTLNVESYDPTTDNRITTFPATIRRSDINFPFAERRFRIAFLFSHN